MAQDLSDTEKTKLKKILKKDNPGITDEQLVKKLEELSQDPDKAREMLKTTSTSDKDDTLTVSDQLLEATPEDGNWKDKVREAISEANKSLGYRFNEDSNDSEALTFKDQHNSNNTISFSSPNDAYVEGEQRAFDELVVAAKKMGKTSIKFGEFEKHPEYKAMLYLACLKHGMKMSKAPDLSELATMEHPQAKKAFKEIIKHKYTEAYHQLDEAREAFYTAVTNPSTEEDKELKKAFDELKEEKKKNTSDKNRISELETQIKGHSLGRALADAVENKTNIIKQGIEYGVISKDKVTKYSTPKSSSEKDDQNTFRNKLNQMIAKKSVSR